MDKADRLRYGTAIFYAVFGLFFGVPELIAVLIPALILTEKKIPIRARVILTVISIVVTGATIYYASFYSPTVFRMYLMTLIFITITFFNRLFEKDWKYWLVDFGLVILEFIVIINIISMIHWGMVW